jgi:hypothetical protein
VESGIFGLEARVEGEGVIISYRISDGKKTPSCTGASSPCGIPRISSRR